MNVSSSKAKWWLMAISIALGCISAWAIDQHLEEKAMEMESRTRLDQLTLLVAARDLSRDAVIDETDFVAEMFPVKWAPDDAITIDQSESLIGMRLLTDVRAGQPLMTVHLHEPELPSLSNRLGPALKAISFTVDPSSAASGLIRTGDLVDLFVSLDHQGKRMTALLLESVQVLGTGQLSDSSSRTVPSVSTSEANITVAVSDEDAVRVVAAREGGMISAVLSSPQSSKIGKSFKPATGDLAALLGLPTLPAIHVVPIMYGDRLSSGHEDAAQMEPLGEIEQPIKALVAR